MSLNNLKIYIAGHTGLVGSALVRHFSKGPSAKLIVASRKELDLTNQQVVESFLSQVKPDIVVIAAGRVGGIHANSRYPAEFIYQNLMMETNLIHSSWKAGVKRLLNFGSSCIYPKECPQPMTPDLLMTGKVESTNEPYAIAKLAGLFLCSSYNQQYGTSYINVIPSNLYGPGDSFDLERCHVVPSLIRKFHEAKESASKEVVLMGSGQVIRDFLFVDDLAQACDILIRRYDKPGPINIGAQAPCAIRDLASQIALVIGFEGKIRWDVSRPDGTLARFLDSSEIEKMDWKAKVSLKEGLEKTYSWFLKNCSKQNRAREKQCASL